MSKDISYEKFYIPATLEQNKMLGFERDEMMIMVSMLFLGIFFSSFVLLLFSVIITYKYKKFKSSQAYFLPNLIYRKFYSVVHLRYLPRPYIKTVYGA